MARKNDVLFADFVSVRHPFERVRVFSCVRGESMTHQSHKNQCDVNAIVKRFDRTGELPPPTRPPQYADVSELQGDLTERINLSREVLDTAGRALDEKRQAEKEAKRQAQIDLEDEVKRLRELERTVKENREA